MRRKRVFGLLLALVLVFSMAAPASAASGGLSNFKPQNVYAGFSDVAGRAWYAENVRIVCEYGLMNGTAFDLFSPSGNLTVAETVAIGSRLYDIYTGGSGNIAQPVASAPWYQPYVDYWNTVIPHSYGLTIDDTDYSFWTSAITREYFAHIIRKSLPDEAYQPINNISYGILPDIDLSSYYWGDVYDLFNAGVLTGTNHLGHDGVFFPKKSITRAEASAILSRIVVPSLRQRDSLDLPTINLLLCSDNGELIVQEGFGTIVCACVSEEAQYGAVTWTSLTPEIATVEADSEPGDLPNFKTATIYGVSPGTAIICAVNCLGEQMIFSIDVQGKPVYILDAALEVVAAQHLQSQGKPGDMFALENDIVLKLNIDYSVTAFDIVNKTEYITKIDEATARNDPEWEYYANKYLTSTNTPSATTAETTYTYVLNINTNVFHYSWCASVKLMREINKNYYNGARSGIPSYYRPCKNCKP